MSDQEDIEGIEALRRFLLARGLEAETVMPRADSRRRLLAAATNEGRFERFVGTVANMADVSDEQARLWLDGVWGNLPNWEMASRHARAWWVEGGPRSQNAIRGFVHLGAGKEFPHHKHLGNEHVLILQGGARLSTGERLRAGDAVVAQPGVEHSFVAVPGGPDLLLFTVVFEGLDFGRVVTRPR